MQRRGSGAGHAWSAEEVQRRFVRLPRLSRRAREEVWRQVDRVFGPGVKKYLVWCVGVADADIDGVWQETLIAAWRTTLPAARGRRGAFDPQRGGLGRWLCILARDVVRRRRRRRRLRLAELDPAAVAELALAAHRRRRESVERDEALDGVLRPLRRRQREILIEHFLLELTSKEIAAIHDVTEGSVKGVIYRALQKLRRKPRNGRGRR